MTNRISKPSATTEPRPGSDYTRTQAEDLAKLIVIKQLSRENLIAERDAEIEAVKDRYQTEIDAYGENIQDGLDLLEAWADANLDQFARSESVVLAGHRCGWRLGNHAAKLINRKWTWKKVTEAIQGESKKWRDKFLRQRIDANKDAMIDARDDKAAIAFLKEHGVRVVQERRFYLDPDREGQPEKTLKTA
jgi:phage host-nuclease inhibitor protein Gam